MEGKRSSGGATLEPAQAPPVQVVARRPSLAALLTHCGQLMVFVHAATIKLGLCKNCNVYDFLLVLYLTRGLRGIEAGELIRTVISNNISNNQRRFHAGPGGTSPSKS